MRLIDLDAKIIITVTDETRGGMMYEEQMTLAEFFSKCVPYYQPEIVDAIPVEWILNKVGDEETYTLKYRHAWSQLVSLWAKEQEAR